MTRGLQRGVVLLVGWLLASVPALAWGTEANRMIAGKAIDSLPPELRSFYEANRFAINQQVNAPADLAKTNPAEKRNQYIFLDHYGRFPFDSLPRNYKMAVQKHTKRVLDANGLLPWQIGVVSEKLTNAFKARNWEDVKQFSAALAFYVAQAHDPFATTENFDGKLTNAAGIDLRFGTRLPDRYSSYFFLRPNDPDHIDDPTDRAFEICLSAHSWSANLILADRRARKGQVDYTDEYYDRFYNQAGSILVRQMSDASTAVASYWLTAWSNAGSPSLPQR